jgi:hypothetical protein
VNILFCDGGNNLDKLIVLPYEHVSYINADIETAEDKGWCFIDNTWFCPRCSDVLIFGTDLSFEYKLSCKPARKFIHKSIDLGVLNLKLLYAYDKGYRVDKGGNVCTPKGTYRKLRNNNRGYLSFNLGSRSKATPVLVHRLLGYQKYGKRILKKGTNIKHVDGNLHNNVLTNIRMGTDLSKQLDRYKRSEK